MLPFDIMAHCLSSCTEKVIHRQKQCLDAV